MNLSDIPPDQLEAFINGGGLLQLQEEINNEQQKSASEVQSQSSVESSSSDNESKDSQTQSAVKVEPGTGILVQEYERITGNEPVPEPLLSEGFAFKTPVDLLVFLDDKVAKGRAKGGVDLYPWQIKFMLDFAAGGQNYENPFQALVRAANGSGKDKYIIATCAVWLAMCNLRCQCVVTTSSGNQLDTQTCKHIKYLCECANAKIHPKCWKINYRHFTCLDTGSPIDCYATDEAGKAEGFHPLDDGCKMGLFMSEAKTVPDEINIAFNKCTGYTHRVHASTPGPMFGHFYDRCVTSVDRSSFSNIKEVAPFKYIHYLVTAHECNHLSKGYIEQMKDELPGGESGAAFRSQVLAEFSEAGEFLVLTYADVWSATKADRQWIKADHNKAGLDLSEGGDETVLSIRNGNRITKLIPFRLTNSEDTILYLDELFRQEKLDHPSSLIFADCGGIGRPILNRLIALGWTNIRFVDNRHRAHLPKTYANRGAETWFDTAKLFQNKEVSICHDQKLIKQLAGRYYKIRQDNTHILVSKIECRAKGLPSPDRADSVVLAFTDFKSFFRPSKKVKEPFEQPKEEKPTSEFNLQEYSKREVQKPVTQFFQPSNRLDFSVLKDEIKQHNERIKQQKESIVTI
jgi:phage terminase large subunit